MLLEIDPPYLSELGSILQWLLGASLVGLLGLLAGIYAFLPNLSIEKVIDKHNRLAFESRLLIRNLGKLPAYKIWPNVFHCDFRVRGTDFRGTTLEYNGQPITRLGGGETVEIAALPQVGIPAGVPLAKCEYQLVLEYDAKVLFIRKTIKKKWHIELRPLGEEFIWQFTMQ